MIKENRRSFLESPNFPIDIVNTASAKEKSGGGRPSYWEMIFWWTRKPLASARAIIAGALLPEDIDPELFKKALRLDETVPHRYNPKLEILGKYADYIKGKSLLDPFAGFGSIPLEALRLGLSPVVAVELLPTAYIFLKAVLEYPLKYGKDTILVPGKELKKLGLEKVTKKLNKTKNIGDYAKYRINTLIYDVAKWGNWIVDQLKNDPQIRELYDGDVAVYIGTWEIKCPHCGKWTPLIGNWWLARVKNSNDKKGETYTRLAWMEYENENGETRIKIRDLNKELNKKIITAKIDTKQGKVIVISKIKGEPNIEYVVPKANIQARTETAICLHCGNPIKYIDPQTGKYHTNKKKISSKLKERLEWYVKYALKSYHQGNKNFARLRILVKVKIKNQNLEFEPANLEDRKKLELAEGYINSLMNNKDPDIPFELIPSYDTRSIWVVVYGFDRFYKLFNPRQLLTLTKLVKLIRRVGHKIEKEKVGEGVNREEAYKYAEVIATYLSIVLINFMRHNNTVTQWISSSWNPVTHSLATRGIAMQWNWCDVNPFFEDFLVSFKYFNEKNLNGLTYLLIALKDTKNKIDIFTNDAKRINNFNLGKKFFLIVTDPPYYDDVPYSELSDFYYIWLKRALSDTKNLQLIPLYHREAFFKSVGAGFKEIRTQWEELADKEISLNANRPIFGRNSDKAKEFFLGSLKKSFENMSTLLEDDGLLVTYYAHTSPEAWEALLEAGWKGGKMKITAAFPLVTESAQRVTARGKLALDTSIIVVWRKGVSGKGLADDVFHSTIEDTSKKALKLLRNNYLGANLFFGTMGYVLESFTKYESVIGPQGSLNIRDLVKDFIYPATTMAIAQALSSFSKPKDEKSDIGNKIHGKISSPTGLFYLITKALFIKSPKSKFRILDRSSLSMLVIGTRTSDKNLTDINIIEKKDSKFYLLEPPTTNPKELISFLKKRNLQIENPIIRSSIDALHLLEYLALTLPKRSFEEKKSDLELKYKGYIEEALIIADILRNILPITDPEKKLCDRLVKLIMGAVLA
ncbi:MAG: DUF1156 domain-containing protein [Candidatus Njordarchaeia archaeon]